MITIFGQIISVGELLAIIASVSTLIGMYYTLNNKVTNIEKRNDIADQKHEAWQVEMKKEWEKGHTEINLKYSLLEDRIRNQEHSWIRFDEKLNNIQKVLEELKAVSGKN